MGGGGAFLEGAKEQESDIFSRSRLNSESSKRGNRSEAAAVVMSPLPHFPHSPVEVCRASLSPSRIFNSGPGARRLSGTECESEKGLWSQVIEEEASRWRTSEEPPTRKQSEAVRADKAHSTDQPNSTTALPNSTADLPNSTAEEPRRLSGMETLRARFASTSGLRGIQLCLASSSCSAAAIRCAFRGMGGRGWVPYFRPSVSFSGLP